MAARDAGPASGRVESQYLWWVDGPRYVGPVKAVPQRRPNWFWLPVEKRAACLGETLFRHQSDARRRATMNARAPA